MKTNQLLYKKMGGMMIAAAMLLGASSAFAQVKIGTSPTTIDPANNLEVEASTAGRKTSVDKVTGQVTIKDGTEGVNKILTSDVNGGASWQMPGVQTTPVQVKSISDADQVLNNNATTIVNYQTTVFDVGVNKTGNSVVIPSTGLYDMNSFAQWAASGAEANRGWGHYLYVNGNFYEAFGGGLVVNGIVQASTGRIIARLNTGDVLTVRMITTQTAGTLTLTANLQKFSVIKLSN